MHNGTQNYLLEGIIEIDGAYWGTPKHRKECGRGAERAKMTVAASKMKKIIHCFSGS
jgi:hypothetical protein